MRRITFTGDLADFESASYDDHIKLYFPLQPDSEETLSRNITPSSFRTADASLAVDIALHDGPIGNWARDAVAGAPAWIGGPRGSYVIPMDFDWYLLTGDETALPAIGRRLEELPANARVFVIAEVADAAEEQRFNAAAGTTITWLHRGADATGGPSGLPQAIEGFTPPPAMATFGLPARGRAPRGFARRSSHAACAKSGCASPPFGSAISVTFTKL